MNKAYLIDTGVLIGKDDPEYDQYATYDKEHGFYDEDQYFCADFEKAIQTCTEYVSEGAEGTYGVVSEQRVTDDQLEQIKRYDQTLESEDNLELHRVWIDYTPESVVFNVCKKQGAIVQNFIKK